MLPDEKSESGLCGFTGGGGQKRGWFTAHDAGKEAYLINE
jgi:hypothetical protein